MHQIADLTALTKSLIPSERTESSLGIPVMLEMRSTCAYTAGRRLFRQLTLLDRHGVVSCGSLARHDWGRRELVGDIQPGWKGCTVVVSLHLATGPGHHADYSDMDQSDAFAEMPTSKSARVW
jgi:hypothetical protein